MGIVYPAWPRIDTLKQLSDTLSDLEYKEGIHH